MRLVSARRRLPPNRRIFDASVALVLQRIFGLWAALPNFSARGNVARTGGLISGAVHPIISEGQRQFGRPETHFLSEGT